MSEQNYKRSASNFLESDEELERQERTSSKPIKTKASVKRVSSHIVESDEEHEPQERPSLKKPKPAPKKSGKTNTPQPRAPPKKPIENAAAEWLFGSDGEEEQVPRKVTDNSTCVLTRRVPGGTIRRTAQISGDLMVELRLYNHSEVANLEGIERCEKAVVWLRLRGDGDSPEFNLLKKFVTKAKGKFTEEGTFFAEKKKKA